MPTGLSPRTLFSDEEVLGADIFSFSLREPFKRFGENFDNGAQSRYDSLTEAELNFPDLILVDQ